MDYKLLRQRMLDEQLKARGIKDKNVLDAFLKVERHLFLPEDLWANAYADYPLSIGQEQTISQPFIVALMTECLDLKGKEKVLEIGTGSGYQSAILAELAGEVYSIERFEKLAVNALKTLCDMGYKNIKIKVGDGTLGWQEESPFDCIIVTAATPEIPQPLLAQLKDHGKLIAPVGRSFNQVLTLAKKKENRVEKKEICSCVFVPLIGKYGWQDDKWSSAE